MSNKPTEAQRKLAQYAESNPQLTYKELSKQLQCSQQTVSRACLMCGVRRKRSPLSEADIAKLTEGGNIQPITTGGNAVDTVEVDYVSNR